MVQLLQHLDRARFEPHLALLASEGEFRGCVAADVHVHTLGVSRARMASIPIARLCWKIKPDAVLAFAAQLNAAVILAKSILPHCTRVLVREGANITLPEVASGARRTIYRVLYSRADAVICQSNDMVRRLHTVFGLPTRQLARIHNPVNVSKLEDAARGSSPYTSSGPHLAAVGRLYRVKGIDLLIRALPGVLRSFPNATLTIVGDGPLRIDLGLLAESLGLRNVVRFAGFQGNPFPYIRHADLVVIPSRSEAFPNAALEALALGTPVVATDCPGGIREIAQTTHRMMLSPPTVEGLETVIVKALTHASVSDRMPEETFLRKFSSSRIIRQYEELIERIVSGSSLKDVSEAQEAVA